MKLRILTCVVLWIAILLSACGSTPTATSVQTQPVEQNPQSASPVGQEPAKPAAQEEITLKIAVSKHTSFAPIFIAEAEGYFKEYGIKVEHVPFSGSAQAVALFVAGDIDIYGGTLNTGLINVVGKDKNLKVVADRGRFQPGTCTYQAILVRKDLYDSGAVTKAADLKGTTIASTKAGIDGYILSKYLETAGLTFADVNFNDIPNTAYLDAYANKTLDVIVAPELHVSRVMNGGNATILARAEDVVGKFQIAILAFGKRLTVDNREAGARFMAAYLKGVEQYNQGKTDRNLQILADASGEDINLLKQSCWVQISADGAIDFASVDTFQKWSLSQKNMETTLTEEQFWDPGFLAAAKKLLNR